MVSQTGSLRTQEGAAAAALHASSPALLLPPEEVARLLCISERKLRAMVSCGEFPKPARIGRLARYRRSDVEKWVSRL